MSNVIDGGISVQLSLSVGFEAGDVLNLISPRLTGEHLTNDDVERFLRLQAEEFVALTMNKLGLRSAVLDTYAQDITSAPHVEDVLDEGEEAEESDR